MKFRFFSITFLVLLFTVGAVTALHFYFLRIERMRLIDSQIAASAALIDASDLTKLSFEDGRLVDDFFRELLGSMRINKMLWIRDKDGKVLFGGRNTRWLVGSPPTSPQWLTWSVNGHSIRIFNLWMPGPKETLQVGWLLDSELLHWQQRDFLFAGYSILILFLVLILSYLQTNLLLKPLRRLAEYLNHLSTQAEVGQVDTEFPKLATFGEKNWKGSDEFGDLIRAVERWNLQMRHSLMTFRNWAAQMAHEIKTPLTIVRNSVESLLVGPSGKSDEVVAKVQGAVEEIEKLDDTVSSFLRWASVESNPDLHAGLEAIPVAALLESLCDRIGSVYPGRVRFTCQSPTKVFANREYFEQAISNLIVNALKYSPPDSLVDVILDENSVTVKDRGPGIPENVSLKLGQPFNSVIQESGRKSGTGLGLAWVSSVCKKYGWSLKVLNTPAGAEVSIFGIADAIR